MNPGELDRRVLLQVVTTSRNANGEVKKSFATHGERWAKMETISIDEVLGSNEMLEVRSVVKFTIRYERINESYRLRYANKTYDIIGITEIERQAYIELECESTEETNFKT